MKSQLSKPARTKASYTEEYKREALQFFLQQFQGFTFSL